MTCRQVVRANNNISYPLYTVVACPINSSDYSNNNTCEKKYCSILGITEYEKYCRTFCNNLPNVLLLSATLKQHSATSASCNLQWLSKFISLLSKTKKHHHWATDCKTVRPMLSDRFPVLSVLSVTLVYCGQRVGCINMPLGTEVGIGPGRIVLDGD